jgi:hypothetical protein
LLRKKEDTEVDAEAEVIMINAAVEAAAVTLRAIGESP